MILTEGMHDCLMTVQLWNKLVQRSDVHRRKVTESSEEYQLQQRLQHALNTGVDIITDLLLDGIPFTWFIGAEE